MTIQTKQLQRNKKKSKSQEKKEMKELEETLADEMEEEIETHDLPEEEPNQEYYENKAVRIRCNSCKHQKQMKTESYKKMLSNFALFRGFDIGITKAIPSIIIGTTKVFRKDEKISEAMKSNPKVKPPTSLTEALSKSNIEELFINTYICRDCKNEKLEQQKLIKELTRKINEPTEQEKLELKEQQEQQEQQEQESEKV